MPSSQIQASWRHRNILSVQQLTKEDIMKIIEVADEMKTMVAKQGSSELLKGNVLANVFFEPSTRTSCSFQAAMLRLGGAVIPVNESFASVQKGEVLSDTIRCLDCYSDVIVLRHPKQGSASLAAEVATKPIINAGDGVGEHPTQALLDLYTIYSELGTFELSGKVIAMVGDLKNGRTVHSLAKLLKLFNVKLHYISPESLKMPREIFSHLHDAGIEQIESTELEACIDSVDVLYVTRIQKERFASSEEYETLKDSYCVTLSTLASAKSSLRILHPLPRVGEIAKEVDSDPRAAYFRQMENGMYIRMALLALVLGKA